MILYAITLKNMNKDENGLIQYVWATKSQLDKIIELRNNSDLKYNFIKIGDFIFSAMDISHIEEKNTKYFGGYIPKYVKDRYLLDQNQNNNIEDNKNILYLEN